MSLIDFYNAPRRILGLIPKARLLYARIDSTYSIEVIKIGLTLLATLAAIFITGIDGILNTLGLSDMTSLQAPGPAAPPASTTGVVDGMCSGNTIAEDDEAPRMVIDPQGVISRATPACTVSPEIILPAS